MYDTLLVTFLVACGLAAAVTPMAIRLAPKIGAMDIPKDSRRMHDHAMPRFEDWPYLPAVLRRC